MAGQVGRSRQAAALGATLYLDAVVVLPPVVVGVSATHLEADLGVTAALIGLVVSSFFIAGSAMALLAGPWLDRLGARPFVAIALLMSMIASAVVVVGDSRLALMVGLPLAGAGFAVCTPATNSVLSSLFRPERLTLVTACKQAAIPAALIVASTCLPAGGRTWHVQFLVLAALAAVGLVILFIAVPSVRSSTRQPAAPELAVVRSGRSAQRSVALVGLGTMLSSLLPGSLVGFAAITLVDADITSGHAATVIGLANVAGIVARVLSGLSVDRGWIDEYRLTAAMVTLGAVGGVGLALGTHGTVVLGTVLAYAFGWGWSGLVYGMVLRANLSHAGATGSVVHAGGLLGSGAGPAVMAATAAWAAIWLGWIIVSACAVLGAVLIAISRPRAASIRTVSTAESTLDRPDGRLILSRRARLARWSSRVRRKTVKRRVGQLSDETSTVQESRGKS